MIIYHRGYLHLLSRTLQCRGSVFPKSIFIATPCAVLTVLIKWCMDQGYVEFLDADGKLSILRDNSVWSGFLFLVGFLTVFRSSQAYTRFWDGLTAMHTMRAEWTDACAGLIAFCKHSKASVEAVDNFQQIIIRLFSMLHAVALADIEDSNDVEGGVDARFRYALLDATALDADSLREVKSSSMKAELVFQWIQQLVVENIETKVLNIPPPILSRAFQELANGMVAFHEAMKISRTPFPFPYTQCCECLLLLHWVCTPVVVSQYVTNPWWGGLFSFLQVFVYWTLNSIAVEIENPFGLDPNDIDAASMQHELNEHLVLLVAPGTRRVPRLAASTGSGRVNHNRLGSLCDIWSATKVEDNSADGAPTNGRGRCCCGWQQRAVSKSDSKCEQPSDSPLEQATANRLGHDLGDVQSPKSDAGEALGVAAPSGPDGVAEDGHVPPHSDGDGRQGRPFKRGTVRQRGPPTPERSAPHDRPGVQEQPAVGAREALNARGAGIAATHQEPVCAASCAGGVAKSRWPASLQDAPGFEQVVIGPREAPVLGGGSATPRASAMSGGACVLGKAALSKGSEPCAVDKE